jgi:glycosyltransferase involved in cell wall biosynthesis
VNGEPSIEVPGRSITVLVVAYYFPPAGGAGVQRVLKWVKYLRPYGVTPIVLTVRAGAFPQRDPSLLGDVPAGVRIERTRAIDPFGAYARLTGRRRDEAVTARTDDVGASGAWRERMARWLRANAFVPDARVGWVPFAVARARHLGRQRGLDAVLTSGPPHSVHLAGLAIRRLQGLPWLADFRDPWTDIHYNEALPRTRLARAVDAHMERRVLRRADTVTTVSPTWARLLAEKAHHPVSVIHNGFDPADFAGPAPAGDPDHFVVAHVGSLYDARDPRAFWQAIRSLRQRGEIERLRVRIVGRVGEGVRRSAAAHEVDVDWEPYVPHDDAVDVMRTADLLLLSTERHRHEAGHLTGKVYEYLATGRPVLGLGDPAGDVAALLERTGGGMIVARDDVESMADAVLRAYRAWAAGTPLAGADPASVAPFSRVAQAARLADLLRALPRRVEP